jgi:hypothetical protein
VKCEVVFGKFDNPTSLTSSDILWLSEILPVLVIGMDFEGFICTSEVVSPFFQGEHDG